MSNTIIFKTYDNSEEVAREALQLILKTAEESITRQNMFVFSLAGGNTPKMLYQLLADSEQDWDKWHLIYGDERYLPDNSLERNSCMVKDNWLSKIDFPEANHHTINITGDIDFDTLSYEEQIMPFLPADFALLGMGEDGHTASLFPGHEHSTIAQVVAVHHAPKPPINRISLNYPALNQARVVCFLVTGKTKQPAFEQWQQGIDLPVSRIKGVEATYCLSDSRPESDLNKDNIDLNVSYPE